MSSWYSHVILLIGDGFYIYIYLKLRVLLI
jgi:hypothetical protein